MTPRGLALLKAFEGIKDGDPTTVNLDPYLDSARVWTIGYGHALRSTEKPFGFLRGSEDRALARAQYPNGITKEEAERLLQMDVRPREALVVELVDELNLEAHQLDALTSLAFNIGVPTFARSTLLHVVRGSRDARRIKKGFTDFKFYRPCEGCPYKLSPGLLWRRGVEAKLFLLNKLDFSR